MDKLFDKGVFLFFKITNEIKYFSIYGYLLSEQNHKHIENTNKLPHN